MLVKFFKLKVIISHTYIVMVNIIWAKNIIYISKKDNKIRSNFNYLTKSNKSNKLLKEKLNYRINDKIIKQVKYRITITI